MKTSYLIADERSEELDTGWGRATIETITSPDVEKLSRVSSGSSYLGDSSAAEISMPFEGDISCLLWRKYHKLRTSLFGQICQLECMPVQFPR